MKILFKDHNVVSRLKNKTKLKTFLITISEQEKIDFNLVTYIFCSDLYILSLNQRFLQHDTFTDILTFQLSDPGGPITAEIYISLERVKENSILFKTLYSQELLRVIIHGLLHLCNYSDASPAQKKLMRSRENFYLSQLCFT